MGETRRNRSLGEKRQIFRVMATKLSLSLRDGSSWPETGELHYRGPGREVGFVALLRGPLSHRR